MAAASGGRLFSRSAHAASSLEARTPQASTRLGQRKPGTHEARTAEACGAKHPPGSGRGSLRRKAPTRLGPRKPAAQRSHEARTAEACGAPPGTARAQAGCSAIGSCAEHLRGVLSELRGLERRARGGLRLVGWVGGGPAAPRPSIRRARSGYARPRAGLRGRGLDFIQAISTSADTCFMGLKGLGSS